MIPQCGFAPEVAMRALTGGEGIGSEAGLCLSRLWTWFRMGGGHWITSDEVSAVWDGVQSDEAEMLRIDAGRNRGFTRMVARRKS